MDKLVIKNIDRIEFGLLSPDEIRRYSVTEVTSTEPMDNLRRPKVGGLSDPQMGSTEGSMVCQTCWQNMSMCPGHFGHIELARPVYHVHYIHTIKKVLECICLRCAHIRLDPEDPMYRRIRNFSSPRQKFKVLWRLVKAKGACDNPNCGAQHPTVRLSGPDIVITRQRSRQTLVGAIDELGGDARRVLTTRETYDILARIPDADCRMMGLDPQRSRPEWMILTVLPVPPPCVRPSVSMGNGSKGEDDLTYLLKSILQYSNDIRKTEYDPVNQTLQLNETELQKLVSLYMDSETNLFSGKNNHSIGKAVKGLKMRLSGKNGRIRGYLMGKRVDFTARTVITGDANLSIEEVGVPFEVAMNLTIPERVTNYNLVKLQTMVDNGPKVYPGANYWQQYSVDGSTRRIYLALRKNPVVLSIGDVVERHLINGDLVLFNRQPTLHKMSMMCHRVRVMRGKTFRLNLSVTTPYNADFDGDEMNLHVAQGLEANAELHTLSRVSQLVVSPQANKPVMGIVQDALCGVRKMTLRDQFFTRDQICTLLMKLPNWNGLVPTPSIMKPKPLWTGKSLFGLLLPPTLNFYGKHSTHNDDDKDNVGDTEVVIENGTLLAGIICKRSVGTSAGGIIHLIWNDYGADASKDFFDGCQYLVNEFMLHHGFSVGLGDCLIDSETHAGITSTVGAAIAKVSALIEGSAGARLDRMAADLLENNIGQTLAMARDSSGTAAANALPRDNNFKQMVQSGSKGSMINISQISGIVGQQNVEGGRIPFSMRNRTLPFFERGDLRPSAKGFVAHSYIDGLNPTEFFFHAMGGREGLIDTACKTAETGYLQRKLVKALEDVSVSYDDTVRTAGGVILQFSYGEEGMDAVSIERQHVGLMSMDDRRVARLSGIDQELDQLYLDRAYLQRVFPSLDGTIYAPVHFKRLLTRAQMFVSVDVVCDPRFVVDSVAAFLLDLPRKYPLFEILVRYYLASNVICSDLKLTRSALMWCLGQIRHKFIKGKIDAGEAVGVIAAQSIGEPTTQMTLNSFHFSGVGNQLVSTGVGRLKELINDLKNFKMPTMTIYLTDEFCVSKAKAESIAKKLRHMSFGDIVIDSSIEYDLDPRVCRIPADGFFTSMFWALPFPPLDIETIAPWMLRFVIQREKLWDLDITLRDICDLIEDTMEHDVWCLCSDDNAEELVIQVRYELDHEDNTEALSGEEFLRELQTSLLDHLTLRGIPEIEAVLVQKRTLPFIVATGGSIDRKDEWYIETLGINLTAVVSLVGVDRSRLYCNDPKDMLQSYGVEAARACLLKEIRGVIEFDGSYVNYRHLALLCDVMTNRGQLMSVTRHGLNRLNSGPLKKCTFEESVDVLMDAAINCDRDTLQGVSESILIGQHIPTGTGSLSVFWKDQTV